MNLPPSWQLPLSIKNRFGQKSSGKQRAMFADDHLLLVLHQVPHPGQKQREAVFFWRKPDGDWEYSGNGRGIKTLVKHLESYAQAEQDFFEQYEAGNDAEDYFRLLQAMTPLHRATANLHTVLQSAREMIPDDRNLIDLRDWASEMERNLDLLYADAKNALDFRMAQKAEEQAELSLEAVKAGDRLNILMALFLPLTAIVSVFGMNLPSGLENAPQYVFWSILISGMCLGFMLRNWVFRDRKSTLKKR